MKNLFSLKVLGEVGIKIAHVTRYIAWGVNEKSQFTKNGREGWYKRVPLTQYVRWGFVL